MARFEVVNRFKDEDIKLPYRKTADSAGYDFFVAEDIIIPPYTTLMEDLLTNRAIDLKTVISPEVTDTPMDLDELAALTKKTGAKPTLVPTGIKAKLDEGTYLELSVRSSCPLKYWLVLANGSGKIDRDYYCNNSNDGEIYFQFINFSPFPIMLKKGDCIGQGIITPFLKTESDAAEGVREGGFGSTSAS